MTSSYGLLWLSLYVSISLGLQVALGGQDTHLWISAVVNEPHPPYHATIECWKLKEEFTNYPTVGSAISLGDVSNLTYVTLPPSSQEGLHNPPHNMFFVLVSGTAHVTLPAYPESDGLWIREGINPLVIAVDTQGIGHYTAYPDEKPTVALQIPFKDGIIPEHKVMHPGPCRFDK